MKLNDEEQHILAGKAGPVPQQALKHQIKVRDFFGARDFVPVTQAHIMADTESLGDAGVQWLARVFLSHMLIAQSQPDNLFRTMKLSNPSSATCHH